MRTFFLDIPFDERGAFRSLGVSYDSTLKATVYRGESLPDQLAAYHCRDFSLLRWQEDQYNKAEYPLIPAASRMAPRPHQKQAAIKIAKSWQAGWRGFVEGDNVGLGKTISCAFGLYGIYKLSKTQRRPKVLVICPKSVIGHWENTFKALGIASAFRLCIINYDQSLKLLAAPTAAKNAKRKRTANKHTASKGTPTIEWDYIIADESHYLKNWEKAQRARAFGLIARYQEGKAKHPPFVIWASATVAQTPVEMRYLFPLLRDLTGDPETLSWKGWLKKHGFSVSESGPTKEPVWIKPLPKSTPDEIADIRAAQRRDLKFMNDLLFSPGSPSIRRNPENVAGWPSIQRILQPETLSAHEFLEYQKEWVQFRLGYRMARAKKNPAGALARQLRFRQKSSFLRTVHTTEQIVDLLENGRQVAVYCEFLETIQVMRAQLAKKGIDSAWFTGRNTADREQERLAFQKGTKKVIFFTVPDGISLHAGEQLADGSKASSLPRATLIHDLPYSGIEVNQIQGRAHRDGQFAAVYYLYAFGTIEARIAKLMLERAKGIVSIMDDEAIAGEIDQILQTSDMLEVQHRITKKS